MDAPPYGRAVSDAKLNRLVGIAPEERQSGTKEWQRRIWGGRKDVRNALYMACIESIMWNSTLGAYYRKKRADGHNRRRGRPQKASAASVTRRLRFSAAALRASARIASVSSAAACSTASSHAATTVS